MSIRTPIFVFFVFVASFVVTATAQAPVAAPPPTPYGASITIDAAKKVAAAAIAEARKQVLFQAVAISDTSGELVYFEKMDNTQAASVDIAIDKARSTVRFKRPTKAMQDVLAGGGDGLRFLALRGAIPAEGGVPIVVGGKIIGGIGASGGSGAQDGQTANAGAASMK
jgi:glc operon protein GlcG